MVDIDEVVKLVVFKCREKGCPVTEPLAALVARTQLNRETGQFFSETGLENDKQAELLTQKTVKSLQNPCPILKLQVAYDGDYLQQELLRAAAYEQQGQETNKLLDDIVHCETKGGNDFEGLTLLYKKIFAFLSYKNTLASTDLADILLTPAGTLVQSLPSIRVNQNQSVMEREVAAALESVLPRAGLRPLISLTDAEKISQLCELANIVLGIRLFNKEIGKGGVGLFSFMELVEHPARSLLSNIIQQLTSLAEICEGYSILFSSNIQDVQVTEQNLKVWQKELGFIRQQLTYLLGLQEEVAAAERSVEALAGRFLREMNNVKDLIGNKTSIPKDQVYPKFDALAQLYNQLLEERCQARIRNQLFNLLMDSKSQFQFTLPNALIRAARAFQPPMEQ